MNEISTISEVSVAARFVRAIIAMFPEADPDPMWTKQALGIARRYPEKVLTDAHGRLLATGWRRMPALPAVEVVLRQSADHIQNQTQTRLNGIPLSGPEIREKGWSILREFIQTNSNTIQSFTERGWGALLLSDLLSLARRAAQSPHVVMCIPENVLKLTSDKTGPGIVPHRAQGGFVPDDIYRHFVMEVLP